MSDYTMGIEDGVALHEELLPLYREHYAEMAARLAGEGIVIAPFNPQTAIYFDYMRRGFILTFTVRHLRTIVGYCNLYVVTDMHNGERIATEDALFVTKQHRNGIGAKLVRFILADLRTRGVRRVTVTPVTDLRVGKIWARMGFRPVAEVMVYQFGGQDEAQNH